MSDQPWPAGSVTGIGSLPGTDPVEASRLVFGELPQLPHVVELPARGAGADMVGRAAALLVDLPVEIQPSGWRLTSHPGRDLRRARDFLAWDLDALEAAAAGHQGPVKLQAAGPWTLAASLELANGHRVVSDHGAARDLAASLAEGLRAHLDEVGRRLPGAALVLQLDEPTLPAVLAGAVPTPSGYGTVAAVEPAVCEQTLRSVLEAAPSGRRIVHCCAADAPLPLLHGAGADAIALDAALITTAQYDALAEQVDAGLSLWLGVLPAMSGPVSFEAARGRIRGIWSDLGFGFAALPERVVATPACGLAGATQDHARAVLKALGELAKWLVDAPSEAAR